MDLAKQRADEEAAREAARLRADLGTVLHEIQTVARREDEVQSMLPQVWSGETHK